ASWAFLWPFGQVRDERAVATCGPQRVCLALGGDAAREAERFLEVQQGGDERRVLGPDGRLDTRVTLVAFGFFAAADRCARPLAATGAGASPSWGPAHPASRSGGAPSVAAASPIPR